MENEAGGEERMERKEPRNDSCGHLTINEGEGGE